MNKAIGPMGWIGLILFFGVGLVVGWCAPKSAPAPVLPAQASPTATQVIMPTVTPALAATPAATLAVLSAPTGEAQRVQFASGAYGATLTGSGSAHYVLWAAAGQTVAISLLGQGYHSLSDARGPVYQNAAAGGVMRGQLRVSGDHLLAIYASGAYTLGVEIR